MNKSTLILPGLFVIAGLVLSSVYTVDEREKALVLQFGEVKAIKEEPGVGFKVPFVQDVVRYDARIISLPTPPIEVTLSDRSRLVVDAFARWLHRRWAPA